jgi:hypothetical protein
MEVLVDVKNINNTRIKHIYTTGFDYNILQNLLYVNVITPFKTSIGLKHRILYLFSRNALSVDDLPEYLMYLSSGHRYYSEFINITKYLLYIYLLNILMMKKLKQYQ